MSASGVQLSSDAHLAYFHPTIREYLQSIRTAVVSNNLPEAQQALARLKKAIPSSAQTTNAQNSETAIRLRAGVQAVAKALEAGDLPGAELAVANLHKDMQSNVGSTGPAAERQARTSFRQRCGCLLWGWRQYRTWSHFECDRVRFSEPAMPLCRC